MYKYKQMHYCNMNAILRRKAYDKLLRWKQESDGESAMLINGARRVGKSFLAEEFAKNEYDDYVVVDFANLDPKVREVFDKYDGSIDHFLNDLSVAIGREMPVRRSLVIFDEVQKCPKARQMIKYLVKDGRYDYIETGSLLSIKANVSKIVIPSEEDDMCLFPLDFEEFLWAMGNTTIMPEIRRCFKELTPMGGALHRSVMDMFRRYMLVGGMPQAVVAYAETQRFEPAETAKRRILNVYRKDISRYAEGYEHRVTGIFDNIPSQLNSREKKFKITSVGKNARNRDYDDAYLWLDDAMIVNPCVNSTNPKVGLSMSRDVTTQKLYMADTGLLVTQCLDDEEMTDEDIYRSLLLGKIGINEGMFAENVVSQCLRANGHKLYFYSRPAKKKDVDKTSETSEEGFDADGSEAEADDDAWDSAIEIDFLIRRVKKISPLEVKSSDKLRHDSLDRFRERFGKSIGQPYILCTKDLKVEDGIVYLPLYMASIL